jgi:anti-anti-sigma regulatory factor
VTPDAPRLEAHAAGDTTLVRFAGSQVVLHDHAVALLRDRLLALADGPGPGTLYLDFGNVESLSSRVLGALIAMRQRLKAAGRRLTVGNVAPAVYVVFDRMQLTVLLDVRPGAGAGVGAGAGPTGAGGLVVDDEAVPDGAPDPRRRLEAAGWSLRAERPRWQGGGAWVVLASRVGRCFSAAGETEAEAVGAACCRAETLGLLRLPGPPGPEGP